MKVHGKPNPQAVLNTWHGFLARGVYKSNNIVINICIAGLDNTVQGDAVEKLISLYPDPQTLTSEERGEYQRRCAQFVSMQSIGK